MGRSLAIGFLTMLAFLGISLYILPSVFGDSYIVFYILSALLFGLVATCTSMILEKLDVILELTTAQSAKLRSLEAKNADNKASSGE